MKHYEFEMSLYIDGELPKESEIDLFSHLAECEDCRKDFLKYHLVKEKAKNHFAKKLEMNDVKKENRFNVYKIGFYAVSTAAAILVFFLLSKRPETVYLTKTNIKVDTLYIPKEKTEIKLVKKDRPYPEANQKNYIHYVMNLPAQKLTEKDLAKNKNMLEDL